MVVEFNQDALRDLADDAAVEAFVADLGEQVAARANDSARRLLHDRGGGGVGSIESHVAHDERGVYAQVGYPPEFFYMTYHELGSSHEKPRPHLRPALFATRRATGGTESAIRGIRGDKRIAKQVKRNRELAKARKAAARAAKTRRKGG